MLYFENDYCEGAHPAILQKLAETNFEKVPGYGTDPYCASAKAKICAACGCPDADVTFISGGTQTNAIVIASMLHTKPVPLSIPATRSLPCPPTRAR